MSTNWADFLRLYIDNLPRLSASLDRVVITFSNIVPSKEITNIIQEYYETKDPEILVKLDLLIENEKY